MSLKSEESFPVIHEFQYALLHAERATGILLNLDGDRFIGMGTLYKIFESIDDAEKYACNKILINPTIECAIYDSKRKLVKVIRGETTQSSLISNKKSWWHFW